MRETGGDGVGRLLDATGFAPLINSCFTLLRYKGCYSFVVILTLELPHYKYTIEDGYMH